MKRRNGCARIACGLIAGLLCLTLVFGALAAELTFNQLCKKKTAASTMLYVEDPVSGSLIPTSALPAGTYIRTTGNSKDGLTGIAYSANNNDPLYGYIDGSVIANATVSYTLHDGTAVQIPEALVRSRAALNIYLDMTYGETAGESTTYTAADGSQQEFGTERAADDDAAAGDAAYARGMSIAAQENGAYTPTWYTNDDGSETEVGVMYMGTTRSMVRLNGEAALVPTIRLRWETKAPEGKVLAVVTAKSYAKMRAKKSGKGLVMYQVLNGTVMRVIETDKNWTMVDYEGSRGYIKTSSLDFFANEEREYRPGFVSTKSGKITGNSTVWVRNGPGSGYGRGAHDYPVGTPITVIEDMGKWCHIEIEGRNGYILHEFMIYEEQEAP